MAFIVMVCKLTFDRLDTIYFKIPVTGDQIVMGQKESNTILFQDLEISF